jgi:uncharacterized protein (DUF952 family)
MSATVIYKLMTRAEWEEAQGAGVYCGSAHDLRDGFIHFSTRAQLLETARKYFTGVPDLVLLPVDFEKLKECLAPHPVLLPASSPWRACHSKGPYPPADAVGEGTPEQGTAHAASSPLPEGERQGEGWNPLRWEPSRGGDLFPHLYAPLPVRLVKSVTAIPLGEDGAPVIPDDLEP